MQDTSDHPDPKDALSPERAEMLLAHDLRSALTNVVSGLQLLAEGDLPPASRAQLDRITAAADHLNRLLSPGTVAPVLQASASSPVKEASLALSAFIDDLRLRWGPRVNTPAVSLEFEREHDQETHLLRGRVALDRLVGNLLENALKFTDRGPVLVKFTQSSRTDLRVSVKDSGPGFDPEALRRLFSFGGRPDHSDKEGTGLGLFIAKDMVSRLGGTINVSSSTEGAIVDVFLPDILSGATSPNSEDEPLGPVNDRPLADLKVLLAEDNKTNQIVARQMIEALGAEVTLAGDGQEALDFYEEHDFDLLVLDIEMPRKTGTEVMSSIRARSDHRAGVPMVALTAYVMPEHIARIETAGADMIVAKPLSSIANLGQQLNVALQNNRKAAKVECTDQTENCHPGPVDEKVYEALQSTLGPEVFSDLRIKLLDDLHVARDDIAQAAKHSNLIGARAASHVLISLAGAIGAHNLQDLAQSLNTAAHQGKDLLVQEKAGLCLAELDRVLDYLKENACSEALPEAK